jgi:hypothetical protein
MDADEWMRRWDRMSPKEQDAWVQRYRAREGERQAEEEALAALKAHAEDELGSGFEAAHAATVLRMLGVTSPPSIEAPEPHT